MAPGPVLFDTPYSVAVAVLAYVADAFATCERPIVRQMVAVGGIVIDDCCVGALTVAPERIFRTTDPFPTEATADDTCADLPIAMQLLVRVDRCIPTVDDRGRPPSPVTLEAAYAAILADAAIVWTALASVGVLGDDGYGDTQWVRGSLTQEFPVADGGCVAVETRIVLGIQQALWCIECPPAPPEPPPEDT